MSVVLTDIPIKKTVKGIVVLNAVTSAINGTSKYQVFVKDKEGKPLEDVHMDATFTEVVDEDTGIKVYREL